MTLSNSWSGIPPIFVRMLYLSATHVCHAWGLLALTCHLGITTEHYRKCVGLENVLANYCPYNGRWACFQWSNDGGVRVKHWSNAMCLNLAVESQYPYPLLASSSVLRCIFFPFSSMFHSVPAVVRCPSSSSNQYVLIISLPTNANQTVIFSTLGRHYWFSRSLSWAPNGKFRFAAWPIKWKFGSSLKRMKSKKSG